ncbi:MAG: hypothetical protein ABSA68_11635 [Xanthobacteraceae bacterium]|jgi:hypothetical protein
MATHAAKKRAKLIAEGLDEVEVEVEGDPVHVTRPSHWNVGEETIARRAAARAELDAFRASSIAVVLKSSRASAKARKAKFYVGGECNRHFNRVRHLNGDCVCCSAERRSAALGNPLRIVGKLKQQARRPWLRHTRTMMKRGPDGAFSGATPLLIIDSSED